MVTGDVRVSGHPKNQHTFARVMGYVEQSDIHSPNVRAAPCALKPNPRANPLNCALLPLLSVCQGCVPGTRATRLVLGF